MRIRRNPYFETPFETPSPTYATASSRKIVEAEMGKIWQETFEQKTGMRYEFSMHNST